MEKVKNKQMEKQVEEMINKCIDFIWLSELLQCLKTLK